jgi:diguanylate cyclase (GGDEF)-like protein
MGQLEKLAALDGLTGIYNRRHFEDVAAREVYRFQRYGGSISLIMLDLDHFKNINDAHGHAAGDAVLVSAAKTLASCLRKSDIMGRFGGEEFIVLLPETDRAAAIAIAEKMRQALESLMVRFQEQSFRVTASFGVTGVTSPESATPEIFFERADRALYEAKEKGRNRVCAA